MHESEETWPKKKQQMKKKQQEVMKKKQQQEKKALMGALMSADKKVLFSVKSCHTI